MVAIVPAVQVAVSDVQVSTPTPGRAPVITTESITGTPGTGGQKAYGTYHGDPVPQPHLVWRFDVFLPNISATDNNGNTITSKRPIVQSIEPGFDNTGPEGHSIGGRHHFGATFFDATELRMLFYDDEDHTPLQYILAWKRLMRNFNDDGTDDGTYKYPEGENGYFQDIDVYLLDLKNTRRYNIRYKKCFPTVTAPLRLDYEPSGRTVIAQSFAVNRIVQIKMGGGGTTANPTPITPAGAAFSPGNLQRISL